MDRGGNKRGQQRGRGGGKGRGRGNSSQQRGVNQDRRGSYRDEPRVCSSPSEQNISREFGKVQISSPEHPAQQSSATNLICDPPSKMILGAGNIPPDRPSYGNVGSEINVLVNFFKINIPNILIDQYDVKIYDLLPDGKFGDRNITEKYVCKMVLCSLSQGQLKSQYPAYNGRSILYCRNAVAGRYEVEWMDRDDGDRERKHLVVLKYATRVDLSLISELTLRDAQFPSRGERDEFLSQHQAATNAVDAIFRQFAASRFTPVGRAFYNPESNCDLGAGLHLWEGFSQSVRPGKKQTYINIDMSYRPFLKPMNVLDFLCETLNLINISELKDSDMCEAARYLSLLEIYPDHLPFYKKFKVKSGRDVFLAPANVESFKLKGKEITVADYFKKRYKKYLEFPDFPCLNVGKGDKVIALPMEVCWIKEGQTTKKELDIKQKREMIRITSTSPGDRYKDINYFAKQALPRKDKLLENYGIETDLRMAEATARILPSPVVKYAGNEVKGAAGKWQIGGLKFFRPIPINVWAIVHFCGRADHFRYKPLINEIRRQAEDKGLKIHPPINEKNIICTNLVDGLDEIDRRLQCTVQTFGQDLQMILCIIDRTIRGWNRGVKWNSDAVYNRIKLVGDTQLSVLTQCIDQNNARNPNGSTIGGLCLKINAKQGGINHFAVTEETKSLLLDTMVIGADVNHPKPGMQDFPSIAAGCVALDPNFSLYHPTCRFQKNPADSRQRQEVILEFEDMCYELLLAFLKENSGKIPLRILYYRDGVSEGQFQAVIDVELQALKRACHRISPGYNPPVTLVCVQKRHHMKMFLNGREHIENVKPGTYLDTTVTHPFEYDFYLCSHVAVKGTAKAAHYHVLHDENRFTPNQLYLITYQLCYCFSRCTKSVSIPPPVYYSDLIAYRYNKYIDSIKGRDPAKIDWGNLCRDLQAKIGHGKMFWA